MGLLERMKSLVRANVTDILRQADDPERALDELISTMDTELSEARAAIAGALRDERKLHHSYEDHVQQVEAMLERAKAAAAQGQDDLAREALRRRRQEQGAAAPLKAQWEAQNGALTELQAQLAYLQAKVEQARQQRNALLAKRRLARAHRALHGATTLGAVYSPDQGFDRLADAVDELDAEAQAYAELAQEDAAAHLTSLRREVATEEALIEAELEQIKQQIAGKGKAR